MSVGFPSSKNDLDSRLGQLAVTLRNDLTEIRRLKAYLDTQTDGNLLALGYIQAEVNTLRSAYVDLDQLAQVYFGLATRTPAYDYQTFAKLVCGVI